MDDLWLSKYSNYKLLSFSNLAKVIYEFFTESLSFVFELYSSLKVPPLSTIITWNSPGTTNIPFNCYFAFIHLLVRSKVPSSTFFIILICCLNCVVVSNICQYYLSCKKKYGIQKNNKKNGGLVVSKSRGMQLKVFELHKWCFYYLKLFSFSIEP